MKHRMLAFLCFLALLVTSNYLCLAQANTANQPQSKAVQISADKIKQNVEAIGVGHKITVIRLDGQEFYGSIRSISTDGFQIYEVDQKHTIDFRYDQLQGVRKGYGGLGFGGKRIPTHRSLITVAAFLGGLTLLLVIIAANDK